MAEQQNKSNTGIIIGAVVVIIVALGWYFYGGSSDQMVEPAVVETPTTEAPIAIEPDSSIATDPAPVVEPEAPAESPEPDSTPSTN